MKQLTATHTLAIPAGVKVEIKARRVRVKGPRGTLQKDFKHLDVDAYLVRGPRPLRGSCPPPAAGGLPPLYAPPARRCCSRHLPAPPPAPPLTRGGGGGWGGCLRGAATRRWRRTARRS